jgi:predicted nucleic acid-binding protein
LTGFVIDASILASWFLDEATDLRVELAVESLSCIGACAHDLFFFEIRNVLLVNERRGRLTETDSAEFLQHLSRMQIRLEAPGLEASSEDDSLVSLARRRKLTVYDAAYLDIAKRRALPLATLDRDLEKAALAEGVALFGG